MKYFNNINTLDELKKEYRRLVMIHHPDRGGDTATMAAINTEYESLFETLKAKHNTYADDQHQTTETPEEFRHIVEILLNMDGLVVELCGSWLWISGETMKHKDELKRAGCRWASKKKMWYWRAEEYATSGHKSATMEHIRSKYGSEWVKGCAPSRALLNT